MYAYNDRHLQIAREDLFVLLAKAIVCAVLGKGCVQRDRIVRLLSKVQLLQFDNTQIIPFVSNNYCHYCRTLEFVNCNKFQSIVRTL